MSTVNFQVHARAERRTQSAMRACAYHESRSSNLNLNFCCSMTSCEPRRSSAYSEDLRWYIVWQREALGVSCSEIATNLNIDISTVKKVLQTFATTGDVCKKPYPSDRAYRKINEPVQHYILHLVLMRPGIYLRE